MNPTLLYAVYHKAGKGKTYSGNPMPSWTELQEQEHGARTQALWSSVASAADLAARVERTLSEMRPGGQLSNVYGYTITREKGGEYKYKIAVEIDGATFNESANLEQAVERIVLSTVKEI